MVQATPNRTRTPVATTVHETHRLVRAQQQAGKHVGLVPTMGALHAGHLSLVQRSLNECDYTVVSIFVNPKQFSPTEDFTQYPRNLEADLAQLSALGVPLVFAPEPGEMYPPGFGTSIDVSGLTDLWEGALRPGHFRGVATVVMKLFQIAPADRAYFGRKDYQQALAVRRMAADLNLPIEIVVCPTIRDADGLALSSRNVYLTPDQRKHALALPRSLRLAREMFDAGERDAVKIRDFLRRSITAAAGVQLDYATIADPETFAELSHIKNSAVALVAARVGKTRLIDNELLGFSEADLNRTNAKAH
ncbi:MAG TPA: pantoate--beta-alanine ligase [Pirellulales bacterium]|jgi:pantoate--beta-alanine ligase|nr:pantoate--beta-alanine ligase [Pirellulales bacterium]